MSQFHAPIWLGVKRPGRPWIIRSCEAWWEDGERKRQVMVTNSAVAFTPAPDRLHPKPVTNPRRAERPKGMSGRQWVKRRKARRADPVPPEARP